jgi:hypothetical protein
VLAIPFVELLPRLIVQQAKRNKRGTVNDDRRTGVKAQMGWPGDSRIVGKAGITTCIR